MKVQMVLLGSGEGALEGTFKWAAHAYRGRFGAHLGFDGKLARLKIARSANNSALNVPSDTVPVTCSV